MKRRRRARELALMMLYQIDVSGAETEQAIGRFFTSFDRDEPLDPPPPFAGPGSRPEPIPPEVREYATVLVRGVGRNLEALDASIQAVSAHWRLDRMARVDRNILRLGAFELLHLGAEVPRNVVINEAVEIAKSFSTAESGAFINGILDRLGTR